MRRGRRSRIDTGFVIVWMVFWTAAMLVAVWLLGSAALSGQLGAAVFLGIWLAAAGFGLWSAGRGLVERLTGTEPRRPDARRWEDGIDPPGDGPAA
jgi:hypothetical protein